jgi:hypothetical protein
MVFDYGEIDVAESELGRRTGLLAIGRLGGERSMIDRVRDQHFVY